MGGTIGLNGRTIETDSLDIRTLADGRKWLSCDFKVTSEAYHDIAVLLYDMDFRVVVPGEGAEFHASISNYYTDTTNLYDGNQVADYHLELTEKAAPETE